MSRTHSIHLPYLGTKLLTSNRSVIGNGAGAVLLDGGMGGQSSYRSIDDYIETTGRNPLVVSKSQPKGTGLADKIGSKLAKLNISIPEGKPKKKNIVMSM